MFNLITQNNFNQMKNKNLLIFIFITTLFSACNHEEIQEPASEMVEVTFSDITTGSFSENLTKTGTLYDRGTAPAYLSGINITANNLDDPNYGKVDVTFDFVDFTDGNNDGIHDGGIGEPLSRRKVTHCGTSPSCRNIFH